jgi:hypothetical protein
MEHVLYLKEQTYLPPLQPKVLYNKKLDELNNTLLQIIEKKHENKLYEAQLVSTQRQKERILSIEYATTEQIMRTFKSNTPSKYKDIPIAQCPTESCRGFISSTFKCGLCCTEVCKDCIRAHSDESKRECVPRSKKPCPYCDKDVYQTLEDTTFCFHCHSGFSWEKGQEPDIHYITIQPVVLPRRYIRIALLTSLSYDDYTKVILYNNNILHLKRFVIDKYYTNDRENKNDRLVYLKGGNKELFIKKIYRFYISRYRLQLEHCIVSQFILGVEDVIQHMVVSNDATSNKLLIYRLDELSEKSISKLTDLDKTYPCKGIVLKKNFSIKM